MEDVLIGSVLTFRQGRIGRIKLNRPEALNSLNLEMVQAISAALDRFEQDDEIIAVLISGSGDRALCAGGDIRQLYDDGKAKNGAAERFLLEEYNLNARIAKFPKPYIALMDGLVMGGGIGVSVHGSHRIVTERSRLAMPEVGIGFVPDVGGTWVLANAPGELGTYLALTGEMFQAGDAIHLGFADVMVHSSKLDELIEALVEVAEAADIEDILARFEETANGIAITAQRDEIDAAFAHDTVEEIMAALVNADRSFGVETHKTIAAKSPSSLKAALRLVRLARNASGVEECLTHEFRAAVHCLQAPDFYEGVRAAVIDKDRNPRWQPATLEAVTEADLAHYFAPLDVEPKF